MRERPILFSGPMVRAILAGTKTQTRRVVKPQPDEGRILQRVEGSISWDEITPQGTKQADGLYAPMRHHRTRHCPYGQPGDRLWVREKWRPSQTGEGSITPAWYAADGDDTSHHRWKPSIHMPRWACRLTPDVADVRVERLQEISEDDAKAEGATRREWPHARNNKMTTRGWCMDWSQVGQPSEWSSAARNVETAKIRRGRCIPQPLTEQDVCLGNARMAFASAWNDINAQRGYGWDANPWVWVVEFSKAT